MKTLRFLLPILLLLLIQACDNNKQTEKRKEAPSEIFMDKGDVQFAIDAERINLNEIELGKLAIQKGGDKRIKNFGAQLVKNYTKREIKLQIIAIIKKISLPAIDTSLQSQIAILSQNSGKDFDKVYLSYMLKDHKNGVKLFQQASKNVVDADLRKYAAQNLLLVNRHLDAMNSIDSSMHK